MRVLRVHNRYQERGGEDVSFESEVKLLQDRGHDVRTLIVTNDEIPEKRSLSTAARLAADTVWSRKGKKAVEEQILEFSPHVVHFNNTFPLISPAAYSACRRYNVPVVQTLHNYRPMCPNVLFYRDGHVCEDCLGKLIPLPGVIHGCYRGSRSQTAAVAAMITVHKAKGTWARDVDRYIAMTNFTRDKFVEGGFPAEKITVKPHFVHTEPADLSGPRNGLLFVGRLTPDKGVPMLLSAWEAAGSMPLTIVGDGPLAAEVQEAAQRNPNLTYVGPKSSRDVHALMRQAEMVVVPSRWYETFGRVVIEAFAQGTPVLASDLGAIGELVDPGRTGLHFQPESTDDLADRIHHAFEHRETLRTMGIEARQEYERLYTPEKNYGLLMAIYDEVIGSAHPKQYHVAEQPFVLNEARS